MVLGNGCRIIWLDTHIGNMGQYQSLKMQFQTNLQPITSVPPNKIDELICCFERNVAPIEYVSTIESALELIQYETDKRITFISSGTLGKEIIPNIISLYPQVDSFYIFCGNVRGLIDWALEHEYDTCMKILDHETDLLVHLARDMSDKIIELGRSYLKVGDGTSALKCFTTAHTLEIHANEADAPNRPYHANLKLLEGGNGLIEQARHIQ